MSIDFADLAGEEFRKLLARQDDVDLAKLSLEFARDRDVHLDFGPTLQWIAARADELSPEVSRAADETEMLLALGRCLGEKHGLCGDADCYQSAEASDVHRVIENRRGLPISLSLLYIAVGERIGLSLQGVAAPSHFLVRYDSVEGPLFLDTFTRGRLLDLAECTEWIERISGCPVKQVTTALRGASARMIAIRMLNNLKSLFARSERWDDAWPVQRRLLALQPGSQSERRDLAVIALRSNREGQAIDLFKSCLDVADKDDRPMLESQWNLARSRLSQWN